jgi:hypothetical protein
LTDPAAPPPFAPSDKELAYVLSAISPKALLINLGAHREAYPDGRLVVEIHLDRTQGSPPPGEVARLRAHETARESWLRSDPRFVAAIDRLEAIGIGCEFGGLGDYCGEFAVLRIRADTEAYARLEELAADEAGIVDPAARAQAAEQFRIYMLRNYSKAYLAHRAAFPEVDRSPYG